ncbi:hypothetical protein BGZ83_002665, partial [Gryganskiella cystojenkinii]
HFGNNAIDIPETPSTLSLNHQGLFNLARDRMVKYQKQAKKDSILLKDAMVAMSCVVNLICPSTFDYFDDQLAAGWFDECMDKAFDSHPLVEKWLKRYKDELDGDSSVGCIRDSVTLEKAELVQSRRRLDLEQRSYHERLLDALEHACDLVLEQPFGDPSSISETDALNGWVNIIKPLLPSCLTIHTGETGLASTKPVLEELSDEYGLETSECARKVDLKFRCGRIEIANLELKAPEQKTTPRAIQSRKNLRLARCIQHELEKTGVQDAQVYSGDISGYMAIITTIKKVDDVYVAGRVTNSVLILPTTTATMKVFLGGSTLSCLMNLMSHLEKLGMKAKEAADLHESNGNQAAFVSDLEYEDPPVHSRPKSLQESIILTPKKKKAKQTVDTTIKPPSRLRLEELTSEED